MRREFEDTYNGHLLLAHEHIGAFLIFVTVDDLGSTKWDW